MFSRMTSIDAPRDDEGLLRLRFHDNASGLNPALDQVRPYAVVRRATDNEPPETPASGRRPRRRGSDRRQEERRQRDVPVLLDTRSHRERRSHLRRHEDRIRYRTQTPASGPEPLPVARLGVDRYA